MKNQIQQIQNKLLCNIQKLYINTIKQQQKVSQVGSGKSSNSPLYSETKKLKFYWMQKQRNDFVLLKVMQVHIMLL